MFVKLLEFLGRVRMLKVRETFGHWKGEITGIDLLNVCDKFGQSAEGCGGLRRVAEGRGM